MRALGALAWVVVSGLLYGAAFPPLSLAPLSWIALAPLFAALTRVGPAAAAALGLAWSLVAGLAAAPFLPAMLGGYFRVEPGWTGPAALGLLVLSAGVYGAALGAVVSWCAARGRARPLLLAAAFVAFEFARSSLGLRNSWAVLADAQLAMGPIAQAADLAGPLGLGLLVAWANAWLAAALEPRLRGSAARGEAAAFAITLVLVVGYGSVRGLGEDAETDSLSVALVQAGIARAWDDTDVEPSRAELERHLALSARAPEDVALVVWPEGAVDFRPGGLTQRWLRLRRWSRKQDAPLLFGGPRTDGDDPRLLNTMFSLARGRLEVAQDKILLVPFAESAPLPGLGSRKLRAGVPADPIRLAGSTLGIVICSEIMSSRYVRARVRAGAELLLNASNDYWFASEAGARLQLAKARLRAIETRRPLVRATSTGYTAVIDRRGRVLTQGPFGGEAVVAARVPLATGVAPYLLIGDALGWLSLVVVAAALWLRAGSPRGSDVSPQSSDSMP